jgi:hypothetical protein
VLTFYPVEVEVGSKIRYEGGALVDAKGEYIGGRSGDGKGLVPGEYIVTVAPREVGELHGSNSNTIPKVYQDKKTSTLKITVTESDSKIDIVLK